MTHHTGYLCDDPFKTSAVFMVLLYCLLIWTLHVNTAEWILRILRALGLKECPGQNGTKLQSLWSEISSLFRNCLKWMPVKIPGDKICMGSQNGTCASTQFAHDNNYRCLSMDILIDFIQSLTICPKCSWSKMHTQWLMVLRVSAWISRMIHA